MKLTLYTDNPLPYVFSFEMPGLGTRLIHHSTTTLANRGGVQSVFKEIEEMIRDLRKIKQYRYLMFS